VYERRSTCPDSNASLTFLPLTNSSVAPALPRIRSICSSSWKVFDSPLSSSPSKRSLPLCALAEIQLLSSTADSLMVTLSRGAAAMALSEGTGLGSAALVAVGLALVLAGLGLRRPPSTCRWCRCR